MKKSEKPISNAKRLCIFAQIKALKADLAKECEAIADLCEEEGYPSHGSNYELRCEAVRDMYWDEIEDLYSQIKK